jgi:hypothetical protein
LAQQPQMIDTVVQSAGLRSANPEYGEHEIRLM